MNRRTKRKWIQAKLWHKVLVLVAVPLAFEILFISVLSFLLYQVEQEARIIERSRNLILETENLQRLFVEAGTSVAGYNMTKNPMFGAQFGEAKSKIYVQLGLLSDLVSSESGSKVSITKVSKVVQNEIKQLDEMVDQIERDTTYGTVRFDQIQGSLVEMANLFEELVKRERGLVKGAPELESRLRSLVDQWLAIGVGINVLLAVGLVAYFNSGTTRRLNVLMDNTSRLTREEELLPPPGGHDEIAQLDGVFREMAQALAEAARKERAIVENAVDVICSIDKTLKFSAINPASENQWGYSQKELTGRRLEDILFDQSEEVTKALKDAIENKSHRTIEIRIKANSGRPVDTLWSVQWSDAENKLFCVSHDITDRKRAEQIRRDVVAMVSHDLRSPLSSILVGIDVLKAGVKGQISSKAEAELDKMGGSASRMVRLINDFLDLEKLQTGKLDLKMSKTNLDVLVASSVSAIQSLAEMKQISFAENGTDIDIIADGDRVIQILVNLLANAVKFSPPNSVITIAAQLTNFEVEVTVQDQGPGIEAGKQERIFESFTQLEAGVMPGSSGLGLSICRNLVELHGGTIGVRSQEGAGSTFWFKLPQKQDALFV